MKKLKLFAFALAASALALTTSCGNDDDNGGGIYVPDPWAGLEDPPELTAPADGYVTFAIHVPEGTVCNGMGVVGGNIPGIPDWNLEAILENRFTRATGKENWYVITLPIVETESEEEMMRVRPMGIGPAPENAVSWSRRATELEILQGPGAVVPSGHGEPQFESLVGGSVVFAVIRSWLFEPCGIPNEAGYASFRMTTTVEFPAGTEFALVGNFPDAEWQAAPPPERLMLTYADGAWTISDVPVRAGQEYKFLFRLPEGVDPDGRGWGWHWDSHGANFQLHHSMQSTRVITRWNNWPPAPPEE